MGKVNNKADAEVVQPFRWSESVFKPCAFDDHGDKEAYNHPAASFDLSCFLALSISGECANWSNDSQSHQQRGANRDGSSTSGGVQPIDATRSTEEIRSTAVHLVAKLETID